ncbi:MAG: hypothetical protein UY95_C0011G0006 [Parcubacteria group bacterium GW2011_GWA2_56_7]|nr:MAG: hypothetical protein UY95_C0011G0006 [Parcubacteria group bacterium GW2011_GWA2_56_7]
MNVLVFGDVVGRIGREAIRSVFPLWKNTYAPTLVIANVENLAHGAGVTPKTLSDLLEIGVDVFTSGNHLWDKPAYRDVLRTPELERRLVQPANEPRSTPNSGVKLVEKEQVVFAVMNVMGSLFFKKDYALPAPAIDVLLARAPEGAVTLLDIHAEATSEKAALGLYCDGKISAVWGSHTHVPTADERILPKGTAFVTDVGMTGAHNESIGIGFEGLRPVLHGGKPTAFEPPTVGAAVVNAILLSFENGQRTPSTITRLRELVDIR